MAFCSAQTALSYPHPRDGSDSSEEGTLTWRLGHDSCCSNDSFENHDRMFGSPLFLRPDENCSPSNTVFRRPAQHSLDGVRYQHLPPQQQQPVIRDDRLDTPVQQALQDLPPALAQLLQSVCASRAEMARIQREQDLGEGAISTFSRQASHGTDQHVQPRSANHITGWSYDHDVSQYTTSPVQATGPCTSTPIRVQRRPCQQLASQYTTSSAYTSSASSPSCVIRSGQDGSGDSAVFRQAPSEEFDWYHIPVGQPEPYWSKKQRQNFFMFNGFDGQNKYVTGHDYHRQTTPTHSLCEAHVDGMSARRQARYDEKGNPIQYSYWNPHIGPNGRIENRYGNTLWLDWCPPGVRPGLPVWEEWKEFVAEARRLPESIYPLGKVAAWSQREEEREARERSQRPPVVAFRYGTKLQPRQLAPQQPRDLSFTEQSRRSSSQQQSRDLAFTDQSRQSTPTDCTVASYCSTGYANSASTDSTIPLSEVSSGPRQLMTTTTTKPKGIIRVSRSRKGSDSSTMASSSTHSLCVSDRDVASFDPDAAFIAVSGEHFEGSGSETSLIPEEEKSATGSDGFFKRTWKRVKDFVRGVIHCFSS